MLPFHLITLKTPYPGQLLLRFALLPILLASLLTPVFPTFAAPKVIYDDALASGWADWSWAAVDLQAAAPVHGGTRSIAITFDAWQGLYLHHTGLDTTGFSALRFYLHGGSGGGQQMNLFVTTLEGGSEVNGPSVSITPPAAGAWSEVNLPLSQVGAEGKLIAALTLQDATGGTQPTFYLDDIALVSAEHPDGPLLSADELRPRALPTDGSTYAVVRLQVSDPQGLADIDSVTLNLSNLGIADLPLYDDGRSNDAAAGDGLYGAALALPASITPGEYSLTFQAVDQAGHQAVLPGGALVALGAPGGQIPAPLPQRIGFGSNAWDETPGEDWQVNSGVPWNFVYQYITYDWYVNGWGGNFVNRFVNQAWSKDYIPAISVYLMLDTPPSCGESAACYAQKLQNASTVQTYLAALQQAAQEAQGSKPVIFHLEPDFYGFMQQYSNSDPTPPGITPDDPSSYPVALNITGYENNLAGFGKRLVDLIHETAPNALVAPAASMWATNRDPNSASAAEAIDMAQRTAAFIDAMGGVEADLYFVEWSDRDAGSGLRPWWDDTDHELPRPSRAILWENTLSRAAGKRIVLWQVPLGNMSLDNNSSQHYRDNRVAYIFRHLRDLADAGVTAVLFGPGSAEMTHVDTDGGFFAAQGAIAYAAPPTPSGLQAGSAAGASVPLWWQEITQPDLWGYRLFYRLADGGPTYTLEASRRSAVQFILPQPGGWQVQIASYDALGQLSPLSSAIAVSTDQPALQVYLPLVRK